MMFIDTNSLQHLSIYMNLTGFLWIKWEWNMRLTLIELKHMYNLKMCICKKKKKSFWKPQIGEIQDVMRVILPSCFWPTLRWRSPTQPHWASPNWTDAPTDEMRSETKTEKWNVRAQQSVQHHDLFLLMLILLSDSCQHNFYRENGVDKSCSLEINTDQ